MSKLVWIVVGVYLAAGIGWFLVATAGLSLTSEMALVEGAWGLVPALTASGGAFIGKRGLAWAWLWASVFFTTSLAALVVFFAAIWPSL